MKVGIIQSCYIPWRGYFDFIRECDAFVLHEDIQFTKSDWRNRNKIKTPQGTRWLTVPVHYEYVQQRICNTRVDDTTDWRKAHLNLFDGNYREAPHFKDAVELLDFGISGTMPCPTMISAVNARLLKVVLQFLGVRTPIHQSAEFQLSPQLRKTERILAMCKAMGATEYLSGPAAKVYLDEDMLRHAGITPIYKAYNYPEYPQLHGKFEGGVSVLDLIANVGPAAPDYIWGQHGR